MRNIFKYCFFDLVRSKWSLIYFAFYFIVSLSLLYFGSDGSKAIVSMMNIILFITPLVALLLGVLYFYQNRDFAELLLSQPLRRKDFFLGNLLGLGTSLSLSLVLGLGLPFLFFGLEHPELQLQLGSLLLTGLILTYIFSALAMLISIRHENKVKGFGLAVFLWLFFAVLYDGIFMLLLLWFRDYPLEGFALGAVMINPMDLARTFILLKLDLSALMGYTGAVFQKFFGTSLGYMLSLSIALLWILIPSGLSLYFGKKRDF
jgi:Cu-processing system permease protein